MQTTTGKKRNIYLIEYRGGGLWGKQSIKFFLYGVHNLSPLIFSWVSFFATINFTKARSSWYHFIFFFPLSLSLAHDNVVRHTRESSRNMSRFLLSLGGWGLGQTRCELFNFSFSGVSIKRVFMNARQKKTRTIFLIDCYFRVDRKIFFQEFSIKKFYNLSSEISH